jgi:N-hydroxyarylamine O-acetyltransferase
MSKLNELFRKRIGIPANEVITFENVDRLLEKTAKTIPFENLCILKGKTTEITKDNLIHKLLEQNQGGLCYELNSLLYLFLIENGFKTELTRGITYDHLNQRWSKVGKTHVTNLLHHNENLYIVDTGYGGNLPLKPVPLTGETVSSENGEFRLVREDSEHGDYILYIKLKNKDLDWKKGYAFESNKRYSNVTQFNEVQNIIVNHPDSPFNKKPLVNRLTDNGNMTLTDTSFTEWMDGNITKEEIDEMRFNEIAKEHFGILFPLKS